MTIRLSRPRPVISDPEVLELLADSPELLAIADAISSTRPRVSCGRRSRHPLAWRPLAGATAVVAFALLVVTLLPLRGSGGGLTASALAAVSGGQTLHVLMSAPSQGDTIVDLRTGRRVRPKVTLEIWFDEISDHMRVQVRKNGALQYAGASLYPLGSGLRATLASEGASPSLEVFVAGYRDALRRGQVHERGTGVISGRRVVWLNVGVGKGAHTVAVDQQTKLPVVVKTASNSSWRLERVDSEQAPVVSSDAAAVNAPALQQLASAPASLSATPIEGHVASSHVATRTAADRVLSGHLAAPLRTGTLRLRQLSVQSLITVFSDNHKTVSAGVELRYRGEGGEVRVDEATQPEPAYRFVEPGRTFNLDPLPANGQLALARSGSVWTGQMRLSDGLYVTLVGRSQTTLLILARALANA